MEADGRKSDNVTYGEMRRSSKIKRNIKTLVCATLSVLCMCSAWWLSKPLRDNYAVAKQNKSELYGIVKISHMHPNGVVDDYIFTNLFNGAYWERGKDGAVLIYDQPDKRNASVITRVLHGDITISMCGIYTNYPNRVNK